MFSEAESIALRLANDGVLINSIPDKTIMFDGFVETPGAGVFKKLIKKGLVFITEEDEIELPDGTMFDFTPSYCLSEAGEIEYKNLRRGG